jgi:regulatory protein
LNREESEERFRKAQTVVDRLLKFRLRSEQELREKLSRTGFPESTITQTIQHFRDLKLVDDRLFARQWISSRLKKPFGLARIRLELKKKGIDPDLIEQALSEATENYDELEIVTALAKHRASKYPKTDPEKIPQRVYGYLLRRGFSMGNIIKAVKTL